MIEEQEPKKLENKNILCYNCGRIIDASDIEERSVFKCKQCYSTLVKSDFFRVNRDKFSKRRNKMILLGLSVATFPMPLILAYVTTKPVEIIIFYVILNTLILLSVNYFSRRASDIIFGIIFAEMGIFANITRLIFINFSQPQFADKIPELRFQVYFFLVASVVLMIMGINRRRKFILR